MSRNPRGQRRSGVGGAGNASQAKSTVDRATDATAKRAPRRDRRNGQIRYTRLWISDLLADTYRLTPAAMGAYMRVYAAIVIAQSPVPDDAGITAITGTTRKAWMAIRDELLTAGVIDIIDGHIHDQRAEEAINEFRTASRRNSENVSHRYDVVHGLKDAES